MASWSILADANRAARAIKKVAPRVPSPILGIRVTTTVCNVTITRPPAAQVVEGQPFAVQPLITVTDCSGVPLVNKVRWPCGHETLPVCGVCYFPLVGC